MLLPHSALSCFAYPLLWKNITKSNLRVEKAFIWLKGSSSSLKEAIVGTQGKEGSLEPRFHERMLLTDLAFIACSPCFLMKLRTTCPVVALLVRVWVLPHQSLIDKNTPQTWVWTNMTRTIPHLRFTFTGSSWFASSY